MLKFLCTCPLLMLLAAVGLRADLTILDRDAGLIATVIGGMTAWQR